MAVHCSQPSTRGWERGSATSIKKALGAAAAAPSRIAARRGRRPTVAAAAAAAPSAAEVQQATALLQAVRNTKKVDPPQVVSALELVEAAHQSAPSRVAPGFPGSLDGTWRLVFAVPAPIPAWAYIPVREDAEISVAAGTIDLVSFVGPLSFRFKGQCRFEVEEAVAGGKAEMHFAFKKMQMEAFGFKRESEVRRWRGHCLAYKWETECCAAQLK